jgi:tRNA threonylcarbamoyl adenosine modification protein YjeE
MTHVSGDLGAGKTTLSRGLIRSKFNDSKMLVTSPSYLLDNTYKYGPSKYIHHIDLYRLPEKFGKMSMLGIPSIYESALCIIEWPSRLVEEDVPKSYLEVTISIDDTAAATSVGIADPDSPNFGPNAYRDSKSDPGCEFESEYDSSSDFESDSEDGGATEEHCQLRRIELRAVGPRWEQKIHLLNKLM